MNQLTSRLAGLLKEINQLPGCEHPDCVHKPNVPFSGNPGRSRSPCGLWVCRAEPSWAQGCEPPPGQAPLCEPHSPSPLAPAHGIPCLAPSFLVSSPTPSSPLAQPHGYLHPPPPTGDPFPTSRLCACIPSHGRPLCAFHCGCASCKLSPAHTPRSLPCPRGWAGASSGLPGHPG